MTTTITTPAPGVLSGPITAIAGMSVPNRKILILINNAPQEKALQVVVDASGRYSSPVTKQPPPGPHRIVVQGPDNVAAVEFTVPVPALPPPASFVITSPASDATLSALSAVTGTATPGKTVRVFVDEQLAGAAQPDSSGQWSVPVSSVAPGPHTVRAEYGLFEGADLHWAPTNTATARFTISASATPTQLAIVSPQNGSTPPSVQQIDGTAPAGANVQVQIDGNAAQSVTANASGQWSLPTMLANGEHTIVAAIAGQPVVMVHVTVAPVPVGRSSGIPDGVWLAGAAALALWWAYRTFVAKRQELPQHNPSSAPELQAIVVSKDRAASEREARKIAESFARGEAGEVDEVGNAFRFRQRPPSEFVVGSLRTVQPTTGVSLILGHLR